MEHVRKGCLARSRDDIRSDGSRIEGLHHHWNDLNRAVASGLKMMVYLGHDHVQRHNIRTAFASSSPSPFIQMTQGSHHLGLIDHIAQGWNTIAATSKSAIGTQLTQLPRLQHPVASGEQFGLVEEDAVKPEIIDMLQTGGGEGGGAEDDASFLIVGDEEDEEQAVRPRQAAHTHSIAPPKATGQTRDPDRPVVPCE